MSLKDKSVVVTGGSRGLGLGLVEALVDQGAKVTAVTRGPVALTRWVMFSRASIVIPRPNGWCDPPHQPR